MTFRALGFLFLGFLLKESLKGIIKRSPKREDFFRVQVGSGFGLGSVSGRGSLGLLSGTLVYFFNSVDDVNPALPY